MWNRDSWLEIFETLRKNKLRAALSGFSIALGIFIFVTLYGFGNGLKNAFQEFFLDDATNTLWIYSAQTTKPYKGFKSRRNIEFKNDDLKDLETDFSLFLEGITPRISTGSQVSYLTESNSYTVRAVGPVHQAIEKSLIYAGRYINEIDVEQYKKHAVIGRLVAKDLFKSEDPLGKFVIINDIAFKVVGLFYDEGGDNEERMVYIPYTTQQRILSGTDRIDQIILTFRPEIGYLGALQLEENIKRYLKRKHHIDPDDPAGIYVRNVASELKQNQTFAGVLQYIVTFVGMGTLIAGIIGISNIMVYVVRERTKELGIRKAIGATPRSIIGMILHESIFITSIAGYIGLFAGICTLALIGDKLEDYFIYNPQIHLGTAIFATFLLISFGAIAGYVPAKRAARIKPIVALRDD
jgi:putative ABC transport system permease protein